MQPQDALNYRTEQLLESHLSSESSANCTLTQISSASLSSSFPLSDHVLAICLSQDTLLASLRVLNGSVWKALVPSPET